MSDDSVHVLWK